MSLRARDSENRSGWLARVVAGLSLVLMTAGCINVGLDNKNAPPETNYVLNDLGRTPPQHPPKDLSLVVLDTQTSAFYDTDGLVYSDSKGTRSYYRYARWTERPGKRMTDLIRLRLDREKLFRTVVGNGQVKGDWLLETELIEFYHDAAQAPGKVRIVLQADVVDLASHTPVGHKLFNVEEDLPSFDAAGAHQGFDRATTRLLDELMDWLAALPTK